jgi:hypothetical protein
VRNHDIVKFINNKTIKHSKHTNNINYDDDALSDYGGGDHWNVISNEATSDDVFHGMIYAYESVYIWVEIYNEGIFNGKIFSVFSGKLFSIFSGMIFSIFSGKLFSIFCEFTAVWTP